jgi:hypothetical protein
LNSSTCIIADEVIAVCKEKPSYCEDKYLKKCFTIRLKKKAICKIKKETNIQNEVHFINKIKRAYSNILIAKNETISSALGEIECNYCNNRPIIKNRKHEKHIQPSFNISRIIQTPLLCYENNSIQHGQYIVLD